MEEMVLAAITRAMEEVFSKMDDEAVMRLLLSFRLDAPGDDSGIND